MPRLSRGAVEISAITAQQAPQDPLKKDGPRHGPGASRGDDNDRVAVRPPIGISIAGVEDGSGAEQFVHRAALIEATWA